jgi:GntR family transcriptional regulator of vanillate catabolism
MTGADRTTQALRELVLAGRFSPDQKVPEELVARELGVSRTLARLAMGVLEREGLLLQVPRRGFRVRSFTIDELTDAIEVRGELEALAARFLAERGLEGDTEKRLMAPLEEADIILARGTLDVEYRLRWTETNLDFHVGLIEAASNTALSAAFNQVIRIPLVSPRAIVFDMADAEFSRQQLERAQSDHLRVLDAIRARKGSRAAEIMRDHSIRSGENKRNSFEHMLADHRLVSAPGLALIRASGMAAL